MSSYGSANGTVFSKALNGKIPETPDEWRKSLERFPGIHFDMVACSFNFCIAIRAIESGRSLNNKVLMYKLHAEAGTSEVSGVPTCWELA